MGHFVRVKLSSLTVRGGHHTVALWEAVNPDASRWSRAQGGANREPSRAVAWPGFLFVPPFHKPASAGGENPDVRTLVGCGEPLIARGGAGAPGAAAEPGDQGPGRVDPGGNVGGAQGDR